ncbi:MAG TPA: excinuclease ABC subunit UvrC [Candidatus Desulfofervidus auxilii]|uniref:UvrABC system protein C n=1 Tax=Desulfofervidus auxilii TaxID=1621989 RepID=A0A7C1VQ62_DESA2|nr:excinuclease ABC subunit UvrC [Candidatus Desulfofervidus auxilii]
MDIKKGLKEKVEQLPHQPGIYLIKNSIGHILYVGKAKDLQKRVKSYFSRQFSPKVKTMLNQATQIDYIITSSEKEALILECNFIKTHKPRYNVVLRDDKNYPYLRIDLGEKWPYFTIVRQIQKDGAKYFGPFASAKAVRETLKSMQRLFPLRKCSDFVLKHRKRPCLNYQIGRCLAPCMGYINEEEYKKVAQEACIFLEGKALGLLERLEKEMKQAADNLEFERATFYRDRIEAIKKTLEKQAMVSSDLKNRDIVALSRWPDTEKMEVVVFKIRDGYLMEKRDYSLPVGVAGLGEALGKFLGQYYYHQDFIPEEIIVPFLLPERKILEEWFTEKMKQAVKILLPKTEEQKRLLTMAQENVNYLLASKCLEKKGLHALKTSLGLSYLPKRIECFDISNIQGKYTVASMVVFVDGQPAKEEYRRFKLKLEGRPNDYAMMQEALKRRFEKKDNLPDLLLIDGGKGQLNIALSVLEGKGLKNISVAAIAKGKGRAEDKIYVPERKTPLQIKKHSQELLLLKRIRDEAHRFAITYYKRIHCKILTDSLLDNIKGIGPKRKKIIWEHFKSLEEIKTAPLETLVKMGLPLVVAKRIKKVIQNP